MVKANMQGFGIKIKIEFLSPCWVSLRQSLCLKTLTNEAKEQNKAPNLQGEWMSLRIMLPH